MNHICASYQSVPSESHLTHVSELIRLEIVVIQMNMKTTLKDTQISLRFNGEVLEAMKNAARDENLSLSDFIMKLFQERDKRDQLEARLEALERAVFHQSQVA